VAAYVATAKGGEGMKTHQRAGLILFVVFWTLTIVALTRESASAVAGAGLGILAIIFSLLFVMD
jgi:hypothetical protein